MIQYKNDDNFGIPQFEFKPISRTKREKWKVISILIFFLMNGGIISCWYYFHQSRPAPTDHYKVSFDDDKKIEYPCVAPNKNHEEYEDEEIFFHKSKLSESYLDATQKAAEIVSKRQNQLIKRGTYQQISSPQGIFHIVIGMFYNKNKAMDCIYRLIKENKGVMLLIPPKGEYYYRVTIEHTATYEEAKKKLQLLKPLYGENISILYY